MKSIAAATLAIIALATAGTACGETSGSDDADEPESETTLRFRALTFTQRNGLCLEVLTRGTEGAAWWLDTNGVLPYDEAVGAVRDLQGECVTWYASLDPPGDKAEATSPPVRRTAYISGAMPSEAEAAIDEAEKWWVSLEAPYRFDACERWLSGVGGTMNAIELHILRYLPLVPELSEPEIEFFYVDADQRMEAHKVVIDRECDSETRELDDLEEVSSLFGAKDPDWGVLPSVVPQSVPSDPATTAAP